VRSLAFFYLAVTTAVFAAPSSQPPRFEANQGQADGDTKFSILRLVSAFSSITPLSSEAGRSERQRGTGSATNWTPQSGARSIIDHLLLGLDHPSRHRHEPETGTDRGSFHALAYRESIIIYTSRANLASSVRSNFRALRDREPACRRGDALTPFPSCSPAAPRRKRVYLLGREVVN
jgi:hypothetical protein